MELQRLGEREEKAVSYFLNSAYKERYYHGVFDLVKIGNLEIPITKVQPANCEKVLAARWQGGNYSSRIWANKEKLSGVIKQTITSGLHRGLSVPKMSKLINDKMNAGVSNAERLVRTEMNFVQNHAAKDSLQAAGLDEYEFIAVLDSRTTPRCQALDGTMHLLEEYSVGTNAPPMHPRCRSTICAVLGEITAKRTAKNSKGENIQIPASMNFSDYKNIYLQYINSNGTFQNKGITTEEWFKSRTLTTPIMTVAESKNFAEFQTYWAENYNVRVADEIKNLNFEAVKTAAQGIETVLKEFPAAAPLIKEFRVYDDTNIMSTSYWGQINFNPNYFSDFNKLKELAKKDAATGFHPPNTGVREYGAHEAGHILELALIKKYSGDIQDWSNGTFARKIIREAYKNFNNKNSILGLYEEISIYSIKKVSECLAEVVSDYIANDENSTKFSKAIWQILKKELSQDD